MAVSSIKFSHQYERQFEEDDIWHYRLGHLSMNRLLTLQKSVPIIKCNKAAKPCDVCHFCKQRKLMFPISQSKTVMPFELVHVDIWGPIAQVSIDGHKYFLTAVDDFTRHVWLFPMKTKA